MQAKGTATSHHAFNNLRDIALARARILVRDVWLDEEVNRRESANKAGLHEIARTFEALANGFDRD
jgi:hypothetical protein